MGLNDEVEPVRRTMVLFFLVDTSGSMSGSKIGSVNHAIDEVVPEIKKISMGNADAQIKIAVLKFDDSAEWITKNGPEEAETYIWRSLDATGMTAMGEACRHLQKKLSTKKGGFMQEATGSYAPAIFMMSDGQPNDDFEEGLKELKENNWFKASVKVAIAIGDDADKDVLAKFVGSPEGVITAHDPATLKKWIKFISVTASKVASKSSNAKSNADGTPAPDNAKQDELNKAIAGQAAATGAAKATDGTINAPVAAGADPNDIW
jgi:uncharacterized protein YegL